MHFFREKGVVRKISRSFDTERIKTNTG